MVGGRDKGSNLDRERTAMRDAAGTVLLFTFPEGKPRWRQFSAGLALDVVAIALLSTITFSIPRATEYHYTSIELVAPDLSQPAKIVTPKPRIVPPSAARLEQIAPVKPTEIQPSKLPQPEIAEIKPPVVAPAPVPAPKFDSPIVDKPAGPKIKDAVKTDLFAGSSAKPTLNKPAHEVQTGGFGDPNGVPPNPNSHGKPNIATVGSFDLPAGGGQGNGSGGTHGARGTVASAGFGNGIATEGGEGGRGSGAQGKVQLAAFGEAAPAEPSKPSPHVEQAATTAVSIESKPQPVYTSEARQLRIEGEVLLRVVFTADGRVRVENVIRGLGHGLDEAAVRAAQGIQFKPAQRAGHAVDSNATLHIVFQLS